MASPAPGIPTRLAGLDPLARDVLLALALEDSPLSRTAWRERTVAAGLVDDRGRKLDGDVWRELVARLEAAGAVEATPRELRLARRWLVPLVEDAHRRGRLAAIASGVASTDRYGRHVRAPLLAALAAQDAGAAARVTAPLRYATKSSGELGPDLPARLGLDLPAAWLGVLEDASLATYLQDAFVLAFHGLERLGEGAREVAIAKGGGDALAQIALLDALSGEPARAREALERSGTGQWTRAVRAFVALTEGDLGAAREGFRIAAVGSRKQRVDINGPLAVVDVLLAVTSDRADEVADVARRLTTGKRHFKRCPAASLNLDQLAELRRTGRFTPPRLRPSTWLDALVVALAETWGEEKLSVASELAAFASRAELEGYAWVSAELARVGRGEREGSLLGLFGAKASWELVLDTLVTEAVRGAEPSPSATRPKKATELWWEVTPGPESRWVDLKACEASNVKDRGRSLDVDRLRDRGERELAEADRRVVDAISRMRDRGHYLFPCATALSLVGHPRVRDALGRHLRVEAAEPRLRVEEHATGARVFLEPAELDASGCAIALEGDDSLLVFSTTPLATRLHAVLPKRGIDVPREGIGRLLGALGALGGLIGVEGSISAAGPATPGDPRVHVQLFRFGVGLRARLRVLPAGASGPALRPGAPPAESTLQVDGTLRRVARDLADEMRRAEDVLARCPTLASLPRDGSDLVARELAACLEVLLELGALDDEVVVSWLEGTPLRVPSLREASRVRVEVKGDRGWLEVTGDVHLDEARVVEMRALLAASSRAVGRFVPLGEDEYLALTDDVRRRLDVLSRASALGKDGRIPAALLPSMDALLDGFDVAFAAELTQRRAAIARAEALRPSVPRGFGAELRDYQREGFAFLARRTEAGLGACLADDMGLGKTVQALALLLHRRKRGPALVVAPTSVCRNWEDEARRFAPGLAVVRLGDRNREETVAAAGPGDVVLVSYGLLAAVGDVLGARRWGTVVYDEAHALKNAGTRRWAAARGIPAEATVALTGTPVENHAGELHALFDLLCPGMLGARATFDRAVAGPIASGDRAAAAMLRQIVRPFVLRRTKAEVLAELPPKTEQLHVVAPSEEHRAFYEAVRRRASEKTTSARTAKGAGAARAHIDLLAELTRLRRAAIDPRLVGGDEAPPGSKIEALVELASELVREGRRALVFSQFLEVLDLARAGLEAAGVSCARLDGTMSERARADQIAAFQNGASDVFLVSLKAGGVGMNLTAADVVILLDPWWNPAVEEQAAGRAHRIGQTRPVTVARIVTEGTIEEKVLELHAVKRKLYEDVVSEADGAGTLDVEAIAALLA